MIGKTAFAGLRMSQFVAGDIVALEGWEFEEKTWVGEAIEFSEWLRPNDDRDRLGALSLDLATFPATDAVLKVLQLPLKRGQSMSDVQGILGIPMSTTDWAPDRVSADFKYPDSDPYWISCTFTDSDGLIYLTITLPELLLNDVPD